METAEGRDGWTSLILLERYQSGDDLAAEALFARHVLRLTALARGLLSPRLASRTDPEDVVFSAYRSFFIRAREGRFALGRGGDLWRLLAGITRRKLLHQVRTHRAGRRSVDVEVPLDAARDLALDREPTAEDAAALAEELERLLAGLDPFARRVLELRLQGCQVAEIADDTARSERSVRRAIARIREAMAGADDDA